MQLFKNPYIHAANLPGVDEILLDDVWPKGSYWEISLAQEFDSTFVNVHVFNPTGVALDPIRSGIGFVHSSVTTTELGYVRGRSKGTGSRSTAWIFGRSNYDLGGPPAPLLENTQFFMQVRRLDIIESGSAGSSPGAGATYNDASKDFPTLGVLAGDLLVIEGGTNAGTYEIDTPNNGSLTLTSALPGASGPEAYLVLRSNRPTGVASYKHLVPRPWWGIKEKPVLVVEATAVNAANITGSEVLVFPQTCYALQIKNLQPGAGTDLKVALDDDGPEFTIQPQETWSLPEGGSTHLLAVRGAGGTPDFELVATFQ